VVATGSGFVGAGARIGVSAMFHDSGENFEMGKSETASVIGGSLALVASVGVKCCLSRCSED
jgi:hypothetical protein